MLADLDLALKRPAELVQRLYAEDPSLDGFEKRVAETFSQLLSDDNAVQQIPALTFLTTPSTLPPSGSLVRFRAMVQDTGMGSELYQAIGEGNEVFMYGAEEGIGGNPEDYSKLKERQLFYVVNLQSSVDRLSLSASSSSAPAPAASKNPNPAEPHFGLVAKVYGDSGESLKTTDVCEFVGVLGETSDTASSSTSTVPALHVILTRPASKPTLPATPTEKEAREALRKELVAYLADSLGGDSDAAEWVLLALVARIHTRHATGMALGSLSLNLALPDSFTTTLSRTIATLVPTSTTLDLSIASLNDKNTRLAPRSRDESLESGRLQLASGTAVVLDLRGIGEGKLEDTGVRNLRHVATTVAQQKLSYEFPFSSFELETDLNFILLSEGKAIVPVECVVYVKPATDSKASTSQPDKAKLNQFRSFISAAKYSTFDIPEGMSEVIQSDFVERRQASHGGEGMSQDDLLFRMTAARLMALSYGEKELSKEAWMRTAELDDRRKERMPVVPQQQK
uniref:BY PROTMAP: gi/472587858/gb/EMS25354.1/ mini-chromosome maintenance complex-binding protein [Rhodosporidium toruloides NP11] gi/647401640/emb/CDR48017.1/ RHTO0S15e05050g1_1 [Rhodosporidium toruloides] n=1 Tax=Rhodotorula toruloides TaxID=5286 RepID=A0A0K3CHI2_RHOTO